MSNNTTGMFCQFLWPPYNYWGMPEDATMRERQNVAEVIYMNVLPICDRTIMKVYYNLPIIFIILTMRPFTK